MQVSGNTTSSAPDRDASSTASTASRIVRSRSSSDGAFWITAILLMRLRVEKWTSPRETNHEAGWNLHEDAVYAIFFAEAAEPATALLPFTRDAAARSCATRNGVHCQMRRERLDLSRCPPNPPATLLRHPIRRPRPKQS